MALPHLLLALSGHGYGHLAQCAPVVNALWEGCPDLRLSVCGALPQAVVADRLERPFEHVFVELDPVLQMFSAWEVDVPASRQAYRDFHDHWDAGLQGDIRLLRQRRPDLVLADIPYRILQAAAQLDIPTLALCSLDWATIYASYSRGDDRDRQIIGQIRSCYETAQYFLAPQPAIPMPQLDNTRAIGPIARPGTQRKQALCAQAGLPGDTRIVLVALGGIPTDLPQDCWPVIDRTVWLFTGPPARERHDFLHMGKLALPFMDVLASADAVLTKPGYGTYAEAVCNGVPVLSIERPDWPETVVLNRWARQHGRLEVMTRSQFYSGRFAALVEVLLAAGPSPGLAPTGIGQAVAWIRSLLPLA